MMDYLGHTTRYCLGRPNESARLLALLSEFLNGSYL